jgi:NADH:ubiquinone oxidoreductase subunit 6 (subunit J)
MLPALSINVTGSELYGWLAVFGLVFNPLLISTLGLESILFATLLILSLYCYQFQKWIVLGIVLGLLTLTRPEGILFFLVFLPFIPTSRTKLQVAMIYFLCLIPWYLFSWIHLGSFVPDTFFIKTKQGKWSREWDFFNGLTTLYYYVYPLGTVLSFLFLPLATLLLHKKIRDVTLLLMIGLAGLIHFLAYSFLQVPPFHWYYVPEIVTMIIFGSLGLGVAYRHSKGGWQRRALEFVAAAFFLLPALGMLFILKSDHFIVQEMPIHSNWATYEEYKDIGLWLKENYARDTIRLEAGEIGTLGYYCECRLLDRFSDRGWLKDYIAEHTSHPGITAALWKLNFAFFYTAPEFPPDDYILRAFFADPNIDEGIIKEWKTTTTWIENGYLILSRN